MTTIRLASKADAGAIAAVQVISWQQAYRGLLPSSFLTRLSLEQRKRQWRRALTDGRTVTQVCEREGRILGFIASGPTRDRDLDADQVGEVYALYLEPTSWRRGIGGSLWRASVTSLQERGFRQVSLWVLDTNARARAFYAAMGLAWDGTKKAEMSGDVLLHEVRYFGELPRDRR